MQQRFEISGLAPHAHMAAPLIGVGLVHAFGQVMPTEEAFARIELTPVTLHPKEGLALLNGTQVSTALALTGAFEARQGLDTAVIIGALTSEAVLGSVQPFEDRLHRIRRHPGQIEIARRLRDLTAGSEFRDKALTDGRRQDPYCIRCQPQILGACLDLLDGVDLTLGARGGRGHRQSDCIFRYRRHLIGRKFSRRTSGLRRRPDGARDL